MVYGVNQHCSTTGQSTWCELSSREYGVVQHFGVGGDGGGGNGDGGDGGGGVGGGDFTVVNTSTSNISSTPEVSPCRFSTKRNTTCCAMKSTGIGSRYHPPFSFVLHVLSSMFRGSSPVSHSFGPPSCLSSTKMLGTRSESTMCDSVHRVVKSEVLPTAAVHV